jgi:hypothetical protein
VAGVGGRELRLGEMGAQRASPRPAKSSGHIGPTGIYRVMPWQHACLGCAPSTALCMGPCRLERAQYQVVLCLGREKKTVLLP